MAWPGWQDFTDAVQNPEACFADKELWGTATTDALGLPRALSGNFAIVFQIRNAATGKQWAVKCFTKPVPDRHLRYREISAHLQRENLPFTVGFTYQEQGIRVRGAWYPIVRMDWVEGLTLNQFVRSNLDQPGVLEVLSQMWPKLAQRLRQAQVTHGDLQHGNVMLVPANKENKLSLKLVDYDGLWVPTLANQPSGELGLRDYQHPQRSRDKIYGPQVDRFSHLVIYTALRALKVHGKSLWDRFDTGENLLFTARDFAEPEKSKIFAELWQGNDFDLRHLVGWLILATRQPLEEVKLLDEVVDGAADRLLSPERWNTVDQILKPRPTVPAWVDAAAITANASSASGTGSASGSYALKPLPAAEAPRRPEREIVPVRREERAPRPPRRLLQDSDDDPATGHRPRSPQLSASALWTGGILCGAGLLLVVSLVWMVMRQSVDEIQQRPRPPAPRPIAQAPPDIFNPAPNEGVAASLPIGATVTKTLMGHTAWVRCVAISPDGKWLASADHLGHVKFWDATTGVEQPVLKGHTSPVVAMAFDHDSRWLATTSFDQTIKLWDGTAGFENKTVPFAVNATCVAYGPEGKWFAVGENDVVQMYSRDGDKAVMELRGHLGAVTCLAVHAKNGLLVTGSSDQTVKVWNPLLGKELKTLRGHINQITGVAISPDGAGILSVGLDRAIYLWNAETGEKIRSWIDDDSAFASLALAPDGHWLATTTREDNTVKLWDLAKGKAIATLQGHTSIVYAVAISPDGAWLATGSLDKTIKIWAVTKKADGAVAKQAAGQPQAKKESPKGGPKEWTDAKFGGWSLWRCSKDGEALLFISKESQQAVYLRGGSTGEYYYSNAVDVWYTVSPTGQKKELFVIPIDNYRDLDPPPTLAAKGEYRIGNWKATVTDNQIDLINTKSKSKSTLVLNSLTSTLRYNGRILGGIAAEVETDAQFAPPPTRPTKLPRAIPDPIPHSFAAAIDPRGN